MTRIDPLSSAKWRALSLECKLTSQMLGSGLTAISRANYADGMGEYYNAFFSLSTGIERLCKLIICFDFEQREGRFPSMSELKKFGHKIDKLISRVREIAGDRSIDTSFDNATDEICRLIVVNLDAFADAQRGRYANFSTLTETDGSPNEPIAAWTNTVGKEILSRHFVGTPAEATAMASARAVEALFGESVFVRHISEEGTPLTTLQSASFRTAQNKKHQKYGRYYAFVIIRWCSEVFRKLTNTRGYQAGGELWFGHYEHFNTYTVDNEFGLRRKIWPLR